MKISRILIYFLFAGSSYFFQGCTKNTAENSLNNAVIEVEAEQVKHIDGSEVFAYSGTIEEAES